MTEEHNKVLDEENEILKIILNFLSDQRKIRIILLVGVILFNVLVVWLLLYMYSNVYLLNNHACTICFEDYIGKGMFYVPANITA